LPCAGVKNPRIYNIDGGMSKLVYARFVLLRASPAGRKEGALFCVFTARLKPCPDTCMASGCGVAVQAGAGVRRVRRFCHRGNQESEIGGGFMRAPLRCARACGARKGLYSVSLRHG
jgi:hypothetical protein